VGLPVKLSFTFWRKRLYISIAIWMLTPAEVRTRGAPSGRFNSFCQWVAEAVQTPRL